MAGRLTIAMLETLLAFAEERSMAAVAKRLGVSQPAVSGNLARMEALCGFELVHRSPSGSQLTDAGRSLARYADEILNAYGQLEQRIADIVAEDERPLNVAASMTIAEYLLSGWVAHAGPRVKMSDIVLRVGNSHEVFDLVKSGRVDLGFVEGAGVDPALSSVVVGTDQLVVVASPGTERWSGEELTPERLLELPLFVREVGSGTREVFDAELARHGLAIGKSATSLGSTSAIKAAVRGGHGLGVVSEFAVVDELAGQSLVRVRLAALDLRRKYRAVWVPSGLKDPRGQALVAAARTNTHPA